jgi:hypothetical protein
MESRGSPSICLREICRQSAIGPMSHARVRLCRRGATGWCAEHKLDAMYEVEVLEHKLIEQDRELVSMSSELRNLSHELQSLKRF